MNIQRISLLSGAALAAVLATTASAQAFMQVPDANFNECLSTPPSGIEQCVDTYIVGYCENSNQSRADRHACEADAKDVFEQIGAHHKGFKEMEARLRAPAAQGGPKQEYTLGLSAEIVASIRAIQTLRSGAAPKTRGISATDLKLALDGYRNDNCEVRPSGDIRGCLSGLTSPDTLLPAVLQGNHASSLLEVKAKVERLKDAFARQYPGIHSTQNLNEQMFRTAGLICSSQDTMSVDGCTAGLVQQMLNDPFNAYRTVLHSTPPSNPAAQSTGIPAAAVAAASATPPAVARTPAAPAAPAPKTASAAEAATAIAAVQDPARRKELEAMRTLRAKSCETGGAGQRQSVEGCRAEANGYFVTAAKDAAKQPYTPPKSAAAPAAADPLVEAINTCLKAQDIPVCVARNVKVADMERAEKIVDAAGGNKDLSTFARLKRQFAAAVAIETVPPEVVGATMPWVGLSGAMQAARGVGLAAVTPTR